jgi:glyceraldehyde 3-phosphate dehydrogenase
MASIAINGLGRVGRAALKILEQAGGAEVVAVNDLVPPDNLAYLLRYDTVYGRWPTTVTADGNTLVVGGRKIPVLALQDPAELPWRDLGVDLVLECTGAFRNEEDLRKHLAAGARMVILSAPARTETVVTVVHGVNRAPASEQVISCASCTTNSITPVAEVLDRRFGIQRAIMTTVHAYTSSQQLIDGPAKDFRRGRAGAANMLPASTGAALATTRALPFMPESSTGSRSGSRSRSGPSRTSLLSLPGRLSVRRSTTPSGTRRPATDTGGSSGSPTTRSSPPTSSATRALRWWTRP